MFPAALIPFWLFLMSETPSDANRSLSNEQAERLALSVASAADGRQTLSDGLLAASRETEDASIAVILRSLARSMDQGMDLHQALDEVRPAPPAYIRGLIRAADRAGRMPELLADLIESRRRQRELNWIILGSLAYPLAVMAACLSLALWVTAVCVLPVRSLFEDFGLVLPSWMTAMFWVQDRGVWMLAGLFVMSLISLAFVRLLLSKRNWHGLLHTVPLLGAMWRWSGAAEFSRLLATLSAYNVPLPEALDLTSGGVFDQQIAAASRSLAVAARQGDSLSRAIAAEPSAPAWLIPLASWGEKNGVLPDALRQAADDLEAAARARAEMVRGVGPTIVLILTAMVVAFTAISMFAPLVTLLRALS